MADDEVYDPDFIRKLFSSGICTRNTAARTSTLDSIALCLETWASAVQSGSDDKPRAMELLKVHLPTLLRLSQVCPFLDVQEKCQGILDLLEARDIRIPVRKCDGPSSFIPNDKIVPLDTDDEEVSVTSGMRRHSPVAS
jgi:hypothetical protein